MLHFHDSIRSSFIVYGVKVALASIFKNGDYIHRLSDLTIYKVFLNCTKERTRRASYKKIMLFQQLITSIDSVHFIRCYYIVNG